MGPTDEKQLQAAVQKGLITAEEAGALRAAFETGEYEDFAALLLARGLVDADGAAGLRLSATTAVLPRIPGYEILQEIGRGGMGVVYRARQRTLDRIDAIKVLPDELASDQDYVQRFVREARAAARLRHPHIVQIYAADRAGRTHFMAMEYVDGPSLETVLGREGPMGVGRTAAILAPVAHALAHAHSAGVIHRDVKPSNILLTSQQVPKLSDLGLAKIAVSASSFGSTTSTGQVVGTVFYMAPEQVSAPERVDGRSDVYALGCTLYQCLLGRPPFGGATPLEVLRQHEEAAPPLLDRDGEHIRGITRLLLARMLAKDPSDRPQSAGEVAEVLEAVAIEEAAAAADRSKQVVARQRLRRARRRYRRPPPASLLAGPRLRVNWVVLLLVSLLPALVLGGWFLIEAGRRRRAREVSPSPPPLRVTSGPARPLRRPTAIPTTFVPEPVDATRPVLWGSECELTDGTGLAFGGLDQEAPDARPHTRVKEGGLWKPIHQDLRRDNPLRGFRPRAWDLRGRQKALLARIRHLYFEGLAAQEESARVKAEVLPGLESLHGDVDTLIGDLAEAAVLGPYEKEQADFARDRLGEAARLDRLAAGTVVGAVTAEVVKVLWQAQVAIEQAAEALDAEPPPRALSPIAYHQETQLYLIFGGDHLDYLTNDVWVFDPRQGRWMQRHPATAPPPRANHVLQTAGFGPALELIGGYGYTSDTRPDLPQYGDLDDGPWTYDVATNTFSGKGRLVPGDSRTYRTGPFHPDYFLQGPKPNAAPMEERLKGLPANTWLSLEPPYRPWMGLGYTSATLDPDRGLLLRWARGRGSEVYQYHLSTNRWELPFPLEFAFRPAEGSEARGLTFNLRPLATFGAVVTARTYAFDANTKRMIWVHFPRFWLYDPGIGDWIPRWLKTPEPLYPSGREANMPILCGSPHGTIGWSYRPYQPAGRLFRFDGGASAWVEIAYKGDVAVPLRGHRYRAGLAYDSKRDRLLFFNHEGGPYDGEIDSLDISSAVVKRLGPIGKQAVAAFPGAFVREPCYDAKNDLVLAGWVVPAGAAEENLLPMIAYDCAANRWLLLRIRGKTPCPFNRMVGLGMVYDPTRGLMWATEPASNACVLRLDPQTADLQSLR